ncbi:MAG: hypothetical protein PHX70_06745 [Clostridium sp.]|nr:hypothetical protein [Clostridium sp.]
MQFIKNNLLKIVIAFIILILSVLSLYTVINYKSTSINNSQIKYAPSFIVYAVTFFALFIAVYLVIRCKKIKISNENEHIIIFGIVVSGILLRIFTGLLIDGQPFDINIYKKWATSAANNLLGVYSGNSSVDYPPIYIYVLFIVGKFASIAVLSKYIYLLLKMPSIIADIVSAYFIYKISKKHISTELSLMLGAFYMFNPAVIINSTIWGQTDSLFTLILIFAMYLLQENKIVFSTMFFTVLVLMKPQGIIFLPLLLFKYIIDKDIRTVLKSVSAGIITGIIIILPFSIRSGFVWIFRLYLKGVSEYPYATDNAFNFYSLIGANQVNYSTKFLLLNYNTWGTIAIVLVTIFAGFIYLKGNGGKTLFMSALIEIVGVFNFSMGMHERYMFTAVALAIFTFIYYKDKRLLILSSLFTVIIYINTQVSLFTQFNNISAIPYNFVTIFTSLLNVLSFIYLAITAVNLVIKRQSHNLYTKF